MNAERPGALFDRVTRFSWNRIPNCLVPVRGPSVLTKHAALVRRRVAEFAEAAPWGSTVQAVYERADGSLEPWGDIVMQLRSTGDVVVAYG